MILSRSRSGGASEADVPALAEPTVNVRGGWITTVVLVNVGINVAFFGPLQVMLLQQAEAFDAASKEAIVALVTGCGAAVSLVANPISGAFSDRTTSRFGRRVPWVLGGAVLAVAALLGLSGAPNVAVMTILWCLVQAGCNGAIAAVTATVPDRVPREQRGRVGGLASMGVTAGIVGGALVAAVVAGFTIGYIVCAVVLFVCVLPYVFNSHDARLDPADRPPFTWSRFVASFYVSPRKHPDFGWAWLTRFFVSLGNHIVTLYLLYFLQDEVHYPEPANGVLILTGLYAMMTIISAVLGGRLSDRMGRRKPLVIAASVIIAAASMTLALFPTMPGAIVGALILGTGYGAYLAVDFALLTQVLPAAASRGKDMGVINIANSLPQVLAPVIAGPIVILTGGYLSLYVTSAIIGLLGAVFVVKIKSVA